MKTRTVHSRPDADSSPNRTATRTRPRPAATTVSRSVCARAPKTFSHAQTDRLQNLIDEWNACLANPGSRPAPADD